MNRKFTLGVMITMLCMGLFIATIIVAAMTPDFIWDYRIGIVLGSLFFGVMIGGKILEQVSKVLRTVDRWEAEMMRSVPRTNDDNYIRPVSRDKKERLICALPDWRVP